MPFYQLEAASLYKAASLYSSMVNAARESRTPGSASRSNGGTPSNGKTNGHAGTPSRRRRVIAESDGEEEEQDASREDGNEENDEDVRHSSKKRRLDRKGRAEPTPSNGHSQRAEDSDAEERDGSAEQHSQQNGRAGPSRSMDSNEDGLATQQRELEEEEADRKKKKKDKLTRDPTDGFV